MLRGTGVLHGDYIVGMWKILQHHSPDDFVLATGETHSVQEFLEVVFGYLDLDWKKYVEQDSKYFRPSEVDLLIGDASKAKELLNWEPSVKFHDLAIMMTNADWELAKMEKYVKERQ